MQPPDTQSTFAVHEDLLLRICAAPDANHCDGIERVDPAGWDLLAQLAQDKRLCAIVLRAIDVAEARALVPQSALARLEAARQWHAFYALKQMAAVKRLISVLKDGGFQPILLKGFGLAHAVYPDPALRPLRDVDVLLAPDEAARAQDHLLGHKAYRIAPWAGSYGMEFGHQLPEVQDVEYELTIEIHHRINARNWAHEALLLDLIRAEPTTLSIMGMDVHVPSPRANFLHLLEHATLHHLFENGPLVLSDLHFLAKRHAPDWNWIESEAARMGLTRALTLVATLVRELGGIWAPQHLSDPAGIGAANLAAAKSAMLQGREQSEQNKLLRRLDVRAGATDWRAALSRAVRPDPYELAKIGGCRHDQSRRWLYYPAWIAQRGRRYLSATSDHGLLHNARQEAALLAWLEQGSSPV